MKGMMMQNVGGCLERIGENFWGGKMGTLSK
jgi:hypothetical protein